MQNPIWLPVAGPVSGLAFKGLNKDKLKVRETELVYLGEKLTADGLKPDKGKIQALVNYPRPQNKQDVLRLLGMVN